MMWSKQYQTEAVLVAELWAGLEKAGYYRGTKTVALGEVRSYIFRQLPGIVTLAQKARRKPGTHGEASALLIAFLYVLGRLPSKLRWSWKVLSCTVLRLQAPPCSQSCHTVPDVPDLPTATRRDQCPRTIVLARLLDAAQTPLSA